MDKISDLRQYLQDNLKVNLSREENFFGDRITITVGILIKGKVISSSSIEILM